MSPNLAVNLWICRELAHMGPEDYVEFLPRTLIFYMLMHAYLFIRLYCLVGRKKGFVLLAPWFAVMGLFPYVYAFLADKPGGRLFETMGTIWLPLAVFGVAVFIFADVLLLGALLVRRLCKRRWLIFNKKIYVAVLLVSAALIYGYGVYEAKNVAPVYLTLETSRLPEDCPNIRIVFASDLHIGPQTGLPFLEKTVDCIVRQNPDIILLGGDIFDDALQGTGDDIAALRRLAQQAPVFGVLGNHESYGGYEKAVKTLRETQMTLLENSVAAHGPLVIAGLDDPFVSEQKKEQPVNLMALLGDVGNDKYVIAMDHRPRLHADAFGAFDLQLSGHTHGGQMVVFQPLLTAVFGVPTGLSEHTSEQGKSLLYVSNGVGYSKIPVRFFVPPEVVVIDLIRKQGS